MPPVFCDEGRILSIGIAASPSTRDLPADLSCVARSNNLHAARISSVGLNFLPIREIIRDRDDILGTIAPSAELATAKKGKIEYTYQNKSRNAEIFLKRR